MSQDTKRTLKPAWPLIAAFILLGPALPAQAINNAKLAYLEGTVFANALEAFIGQILPAGSRIKTGAASLCELVFSNRNVIRMGQNTVLSLDPEAPKTIDLRSGSLALVLKKLDTLSGAGPKFKVRTPSAAAGVRGTSFFLKVEDPETTYVCCCNGRLSVEDPDRRERRDIEASHHKAFTFTVKGGETIVKEAGMLYHDDETVEKIARRIGERIDWTRIEGR